MAPDLYEENRLLREFYDSWVFFHKVKNEPVDSEKWTRIRLEKAAQALTDAAGAVSQHIKAYREPAH